MDENNNNFIGEIENSKEYWMLAFEHSQEENHRLREENERLKAEVERLRGGVPDFGAQSKIAIAGQLANSNAPIQQAEMSKAIKNLDQLYGIEEDEAKIRGASRAIKDIREKYPWRHVPGLTCEQPGKMTIEENHGD